MREGLMTRDQRYRLRHPDRIRRKNRKDNSLRSKCVAWMKKYRPRIVERWLGGK